jgi:hypothetical protein
LQKGRISKKIDQILLTFNFLVACIFKKLGRECSIS